MMWRRRACPTTTGRHVGPCACPVSPSANGCHRAVGAWSTSCSRTNPKVPMSLPASPTLTTMSTRTSTRTSMRTSTKKLKKTPITWTRLRPGFRRRAKGAADGTQPRMPTATTLTSLRRCRHRESQPGSWQFIFRWTTRTRCRTDIPSRPMRASASTTCRIARYTKTHWPKSGSPARRSRGPTDSTKPTASQRRQILRITVTTLPSMAASLPGMGSKAGLCGISQIWPPVRLNVLTVASPSIIAATMSPLSATFC